MCNISKNMIGELKQVNTWCKHAQHSIIYIYMYKWSFKGQTNIPSTTPVVKEGSEVLRIVLFSLAQWGLLALWPPQIQGMGGTMAR